MRRAMATGVWSLLLAAWFGLAPGPGFAVTHAASTPDLSALPPIPKSPHPRLTPWGEPDLRGVWPLDPLAYLPLQRSVAMGERVLLTDVEFQEREKRIAELRGKVDTDFKRAQLDDGVWLGMSGAGGRRTSQLIDPPNGRLPELTEEGKRLEKAARSSWIRGQAIDWTTDLDLWERCVTRGFPASMLPFSHDNGLRIFQSPGVVAIELEMIHETRIIPTDGRPAVGPQRYLGVSRGHWEGATLVVETSRIRPGSTPLNQQTSGAPRNNTIPMSPEARVVERLTRTGADSMVYEMTYSDPVIWTRPFTVRLDWRRDEGYRIYEYACHEGNHVVRGLIQASRRRRAEAAAQAGASSPP